MNYPSPTNITNIADLARYSNTVSGNIFWDLIIASVFMIYMITASRTGDLRQSALTASVICVILSTFLLVGGISTQSIAPTLVYLVIAIITAVLPSSNST